MSNTTDIILAADVWQDVEPGTEALVEEWMVKAGDAVKAGQPLVSVVVVKTSHEVPAPADGVIDAILVPAEGTFKPGQSLATLRSGA